MLHMQHITKKIQSEVPRRSIALRIMPPLGWGEILFFTVSFKCSA